MPEKYIKRKLVLKKKIKLTISKVMITTIILLVGMIIVKKEPNTKMFFKQNLYEKSIKFTKTKEIYNKYFGNILSLDQIMYKESPVFNETLTYNSKKTYKDGVELTVTEGYMVPNLNNGIVVYIGEKEEYGTTVIVEQENGIDVFYSNITFDGLKLYDYVEKGEYIGRAKTSKIYLLFQKDGEVLDYKNYI
jgi:stage IV sporulation protein FA